MLTLERGRWESIYRIGRQKGTWASGPNTVRRHVLDIRWGPVVRWLPDFRYFCSVMGRRISGSWAGCPVARDGPDVRAWGPDVRADLADSGALWIADRGEGVPIFR